MRKLTQAVVVFIVVFAVAQFVRPVRANPAIDAGRTIQAHPGMSSELGAILDRSCRDCHSNATVWPRYAEIAPLSWLMSYAVTKGRSAVNFSEWASYSPDQQRLLLSVSCDDVRSGKMPSIYTILQPDTRLSKQDIETICAAAQQK
jgi:Haem-binding domain